VSFKNLSSDKEMITSLIGYGSKV